MPTGTPVSAGAPSLPAPPCVPFNASVPAIELRAVLPASVRALDGSHRCVAASSSGIAQDQRGRCTDLGVGSADSRWRQLRYLPATLAPTPMPGASVDAERLQDTLSRLQFGGCGGASTVAELPRIGFCATIEYAMLAMATAASSGVRLVLGRRSAPVWTSEWMCGAERSLRCYFNISSCCFTPPAMEGAGGAGGAALGRLGKAGKGAAFMSKAGRDRSGGVGPRAISLGGALSRFSSHGSLWVSGQLAHFFFSRMLPALRAQLDARREAHPRGRTPPTIGMHIRRGDSCALGSRFCPSNLTAHYFGPAAELRRAYGINRLLVATDDPSAARLCEQRVMGFECRTMAMDRQRFQSFTSIERRVVGQRSGALSGSAVAVDALADVDMLADCDAHVLVLRSAVSRLSLALSVARKGRYAPLISLQWPWGGLPYPPLAAPAASKAGSSAAGRGARGRGSPPTFAHAHAVRTRPARRGGAWRVPGPR